jgi:hypothetical protein
MSKGRMKDIWAEAEQDKDLSTVGGRIRHARAMMAMTQQEVADALPDLPGRKKSRASIAQYEMGSPPGLDVITDLAAILQQSASYLAFGEEPTGGATAFYGDKVPVRFHSDQPSDDCALFPRGFLNELGAGKGAHEVIRLAADAPLFGVKQRDFLLVDTAISHLVPDGQLYAVITSGGFALVRCDLEISERQSDAVHLTTGEGVHHSLPSKSVQVAGRVIASFQRETR